jgi:hypothetical protein
MLPEPISDSQPGCGNQRGNQNAPGIHNVLNHGPVKGRCHEDLLMYDHDLRMKANIELPTSNAQRRTGTVAEPGVNGKGQFNRRDAKSAEKNRKEEQ